MNPFNLLLLYLLVVLFIIQFLYFFVYNKIYYLLYFTIATLQVLQFLLILQQSLPKYAQKIFGVIYSKTHTKMYNTYPGTQINLKTLLFLLIFSHITINTAISNSNFPLYPLLFSLRTHILPDTPQSLLLEMPTILMILPSGHFLQILRKFLPMAI